MALAGITPGMEAAEEGLPATERLPENNVVREDEEGEEPWTKLVERCCEGSLALIASASAREA